MANQQFDERLPYSGAIVYGTSAGTDIQEPVHGDYAGTRIDFLKLANYDSVDHTILIGFESGSFVCPVAVVTLAAAVAGVPSTQEVISTQFSSQQALIVPGGGALGLQILEAITDNATPVAFVFIGGPL